MANKNNDKEIYCSFCGKPQDLVSRLIAGSGAYMLSATEIASILRLLPKCPRRILPRF